MMAYLRQILVTYCFATSVVLACNTYDDMGHRLYLATDANRIISLSPDITETLFAIGAGDKIIGTVDGSDYPEAARQIKKIGSVTGLDVEAIMALSPDLVITWGSNFAREIKLIEGLGVKIYHSNPKTLQDIAISMKKLGCLTGKQSQAYKQALVFQQVLKGLREEYHQNEPMRVFYQLSGQGLMTVNEDSWINQAIELCGGRNIFADAKMLNPEIDMETIVAADPQVIVAAAHNGNWMHFWAGYQNISAVKNHRLVTVNPDLIDRPAPRVLQGIQQLCVGLAPYFYIKNHTVNKFKQAPVG